MEVTASPAQAVIMEATLSPAQAVIKEATESPAQEEITAPKTDTADINSTYL